MNLYKYSPLGTNFSFLDPDDSTLRETLPGNIYEPAVSEILKELLERDSLTVIDVGALYGYFACFCSKISPTSEVHAFEPVQLHCDVINQNIKINNLNNVKVHTVALSDNAESHSFKGKTLLHSELEEETHINTNLPLKNNKKIYPTLFKKQDQYSVDTNLLFDYLGFGYSSIKHYFRQIWTPSPNLTVDCMTFDDWAKANNVSADIVKIDVHGAEVKVLRGMKEALKNDIKHILLELHTDHMLVEGTHREAISLMLEAGFTLYELNEFRSNKSWTCDLLDESSIEKLTNPEKWTTVQNITMRMIYANK